MNSPLPYIGGKSKLADTIIKMVPEHTAYCEVFAGAAWVFFRKERSKYEVINDLDGDLISFYRVLQNHLEEFTKQFRWILSSREWFEDFKSQQESKGLTDIQRSARYYYLQRHCFGGRVRDVRCRRHAPSADQFVAAGGGAVCRSFEVSQGYHREPDLAGFC